MYIHLGNDVVINEKKIIGIFDIENTTVSKDTRNFLAACAKKGQETDVSLNMPKSFTVCEKDGKTEVYISPISVSTLRKRHKKIQEHPLWNF